MGALVQGKRLSFELHVTSLRLHLGSGLGLCSYKCQHSSLGAVLALMSACVTLHVRYEIKSCTALQSFHAVL